MLEDKVDKLLSDNKKTHTKLDIANDKLNEANDNIQTLIESSEKIQDKLDKSNNMKVVKSKNPEDLHRFVIVKKHSDDGDDPEYSALRIQKKLLISRLNIHKKKYPECKIIVNIPEIPNSINLWIRVKEKLVTKKKIINCKNTNFDLYITYSQTRFIKDIQEIHKERFKNNYDGISDSDSEED